MRQKIKNEMKKAGIEAVGFCDFKRLSAHLLPCRAAARLPQHAATVIICAFPYRVAREKPFLLSRYAAVPDYHPIVLQYLSAAAERLAAAFPGAVFVPFCDNSPIPEVFCAAAAGLGVQGDNGLLLTKRFGSDVFLGELVTDLALPAPDYYATCRHCGACKRACPKQQTCLSAVSQKKGDFSVGEAALLRQNGILWGCDICADACPYNQNTEIAPLPEFAAGYRSAFSPTEDFSGRAYLWRGENPILRNYKNLIDK